MKKGFTLIELLIVVAIIAILAAIAVPNFLEAQVRSKVARAKSDLRTITLAVEAYMIDNNKAPLDFVDMEKFFGVGGALQYKRAMCYNKMTTPVAYLSSYLRDPFAVNVKDINPNTNREEIKFYYYVQCFQSGSRTDGQRKLQKARGYNYGLYSIGPTGVESSPWLEDMMVGSSAPATIQSYAGKIYDPSNGTISNGRISRTNKGYMEASEVIAK